MLICEPRFLPLRHAIFPTRQSENGHSEANFLKIAIFPISHGGIACLNGQKVGAHQSVSFGPECGGGHGSSSEQLGCGKSLPRPRPSRNGALSKPLEHGNSCSGPAPLHKHTCPDSPAPRLFLTLLPALKLTVCKLGAL